MKFSLNLYGPKLCLGEMSDAGIGIGIGWFLCNRLQGFLHSEFDGLSDQGFAVDGGDHFGIANGLSILLKLICSWLVGILELLFP